LPPGVTRPVTANLTSRYYATSRDFLVTDTERADVSAITAVFNADFGKKTIRPGDGNDLVWSPTDSQDQLIALINGATNGTAHAKIFIGSENFSSTSLNQNRELGLIISNHPVMSAIAGTFASYFRNGKHWSST
jgi:hypothetical protein